MDRPRSCDVLGLYEGNRRCLLNDLWGVIFAARGCHIVTCFREQGLVPARTCDIINSVCGALLDQPEYAPLYPSLNTMRLVASRALLGLVDPVNDPTDATFVETSVSMIRMTESLNGSSVSPLPFEVFDKAAKNFLEKIDNMLGVRQQVRVSCDNCGVRTKTYWCNGCRVYRYCGRECQMANYSTHRKTCKAIRCHLSVSEQRYPCGHPK